MSDLRSEPHLFVLMGLSGVGKTTILRYLEERFNADSAPKYTTRPSRNTEEDARDFIFCQPDEFPGDGLLVFESYGHLFGIQLEKIHDSFRRGRSHAVVVGDCNIVSQLSAIYSDLVIPILVYCSSSVLRRRLFAEPSSHRAKRWPQVRKEISTIYDQLGCIELVVNNSGPLATTFEQIDRILPRRL